MAPIEPVTCLNKNTKITLFNGKKKKVKDLKVGDELLSYNFETKSLEPSKLMDIRTPRHKHLIKIKFPGYFDSVVCTHDHPFFNGQFWTSFNPYRTEMYYSMISECALLKEGEMLQTSIGFKRVESIEIIEKLQITYCIKQVSKNRNYFANDLLTCVEI